MTIMKKLFYLFIIIAVAVSCKNDKKVTIKGSFTDKAPKSVYLERNDLGNNIIIDTAKVKNNSFTFHTEIKEPEFYQIGIDEKDFISILALPGEKIRLSFTGSPMVMNYTVTGSEESDKVRELEQRLYNTKKKLDSLRIIYNALPEADLNTTGTVIQKEFTDIVNAQRMDNIRFILSNYKSMAAIKALYQRIDENAYVLFQPRDLQYLKIVSDSLGMLYPGSKHVIALKENVKQELNQMYFNRIEALAEEKGTPLKINPELLNVNGERVSIESLRGRYVLLTFWATASESSISENEFLKKLYKQYHSKGLEIYQISLDTDINTWRGYVKFEDIPWISVIEDDPLNPYYARTLAVTTLPSNFLFDKEGNIINSNLHGRNLQIRMDQLFNR